MNRPPLYKDTETPDEQIVLNVDRIEELSLVEFRPRHCIELVRRSPQDWRNGYRGPEGRISGFQFSAKSFPCLNRKILSRNINRRAIFNPVTNGIRISVNNPASFGNRQTHCG